MLSVENIKECELLISNVIFNHTFGKIFVRCITFKVIFQRHNDCGNC